MEITLKKPLLKDNKEIDKLVLNLDGLSGHDLIAIENELRERGNQSLKPLGTTEGTAVIAAKASGLLPEDIMGLGAFDFLEVTSSVFIFLFGQG